MGLFFWYYLFRYACHDIKHLQVIEPFALLAVSCTDPALDVHVKLPERELGNFRGSPSRAGGNYCEDCVPVGSSFVTSAFR
jgi:hypothetical protein